MLLKSFGCSFIFGTDLADVNSQFGEPYSQPSRLTWPSLLAQSLGYDYQCHARPGSGNLRILEKILSHSATDTDCMYVVGWSWIDRFDYTVNQSGRDHVYDLAGTELWKTVMPVDLDERARVYYRDLHSEYKDKLSSLIYIQTAIDVLKRKHIPFVMTYIDDLLFEKRRHANAAVIELQNYVRPHMTQFDQQNFLDFSKSRNFPISDTLHPLEPAHQAAFELIKSYNLV